MRSLALSGCLLAFAGMTLAQPMHITTTVGPDGMPIYTLNGKPLIPEKPVEFIHLPGDRWGVPFRPMPDEELVAQADAIVLATVTAAEPSAAESSAILGRSTVSVKVDRVLKGEVGETLALQRVPILPAKTSVPDAAPGGLLPPGQQLVLFLQRERDGYGLLTQGLAAEGFAMRAAGTAERYAALAARPRFTATLAAPAQTVGFGRETTVTVAVANAGDTAYRVEHAGFEVRYLSPKMAWTGLVMGRNAGTIAIENPDGSSVHRIFSSSRSSKGTSDAATVIAPGATVNVPITGTLLLPAEMAALPPDSYLCTPVLIRARMTLRPADAKAAGDSLPVASPWVRAVAGFPLPE